MLDLLGAILIVTGSIGFGYLYMEKERKRIEILERISYIFKLLKSEITYKKQPLPCACRVSGEKIADKEGRVLLKIADTMESGEGIGFAEIWRDSWQEYLKASCLSEEERSRVLDFASFVGYDEEALQENMMEHQCREFTLLAGKVREELEKKKRVVLTLGACLGILFVLILL
ncbi:MAG: stage III sporulation protein AB [Lachnospiraceae bacterium]